MELECSSPWDGFAFTDNNKLRKESVNEERIEEGKPPERTPCMGKAELVWGWLNAMG